VIGKMDADRVISLLAQLVARLKADSLRQLSDSPSMDEAAIHAVEWLAGYVSVPEGSVWNRLTTIALMMSAAYDDIALDLACDSDECLSLTMPERILRLLTQDQEYYARQVGRPNPRVVFNGALEIFQKANRSYSLEHRKTSNTTEIATATPTATLNRPAVFLS
jgi:hypothetical protein